MERLHELIPSNEIELMDSETPSRSILSRRSFVAGAAALGLLGSVRVPASTTKPKRTSKWALTLFSKHLQWMEYDRLADALAELQFDGVDVTVRPGGHVLPENVEDDLPRITEAVRNVGLDVMMITTRISDPDDAATEAILKTASALGIGYYRIGSWRYDMDRDILPQLHEWNAKLETLSGMNEHYNTRAGYHNHSGHNYIGAPMWDIYEMMKGVDRKWVGCNLDLAHAIAEGGYGAWEINFKLLADRVKMCAVKDSLWVKKGEGEWRMTHPAVGQGMTPWPRALRMLKESGFSGPFSMHFEYPISGDSEKEKQRNLLDYIRRDRQVFWGWLQEAGMG